MANVADQFSFSSWLDKSSWSREQAALLFSGLDPELEDPRPDLDLPARLLSIDVAKWSRLIDDSIAIGRLQKDDCPQAWISWAASTGVDLPEELLRVAHRKPERGREDNGNPDGDLRTRERKTLYRIILGLAHGAGIKFTYLSKDSESVSETLNKLGISVSRRTVEEHLKRARELLPASAKTPSTK